MRKLFIPILATIFIGCAHRVLEEKQGPKIIKEGNEARSVVEFNNCVFTVKLRQPIGTPGRQIFEMDVDSVKICNPYNEAEWGVVSGLMKALILDYQLPKDIVYTSGIKDFPHRLNMWVNAMDAIPDMDRNVKNSGKYERKIYEKVRQTLADAGIFTEVIESFDQMGYSFKGHRIEKVMLLDPVQIEQGYGSPVDTKLSKIPWPGVINLSFEKR